jgi:nucleoside-diphosphate-sugar epimerase
MKLLILGMGYTARALLREWPADWPRDFVVTTRSRDKAEALGREGLTARIFPGDDLGPDLAQATHVLATAGPAEGRDPVLAVLRDAMARAAPRLTWAGYLSTTGVYGDHDGGWVSEETPLAPTTERGRARVAAEAEWQALHRDHGLPLHVFRLAGIYGPGRGPFEKVRDGTARRIVKPGQVFSRCHVEDIAQVLIASMRRPNPGAVYNICDDDPAPPQDVIAHAAHLLGLPPPPEVAFEEADLGPMARSFYAESKRVRNDRIKSELGVTLRYPDYRAGLAALLEHGSEDE